jgi:putative peptide zinc metalloprotease protein
MSEQRPGRGLEILVRKRGDESSFTLKVLESDRVFLRLAPTRSLWSWTEEDTVQEAEGLVHVFRNLRTDKYLRMSTKEYAILQRMDGTHTIQDLAGVWFFEFGSFEFAELRSFLNRCRSHGLIEVQDTALLRRRTRSRSEVDKWLQAVLDFDRRKGGVDPTFQRLDRWLGWTFHRWMLPLHAAVMTLGLVGWTRHRFTGGFGAETLPLWASVLTFLLLTPLCMSLHEAAHGLSCKRFGRKVEAVGVTLMDGFVPTLYVDASDMWMSTRAGRIVVSLGGPALNVWLGAVAAVAAFVIDSPTGSWTLVVFADVNLALALYTLWPFHGIKEDGYDALTDLTRIVSLRERSWLGVRGFLTGDGLDGESPMTVLSLGGYALLTGLTWLTLVVVAGVLLVI